MRILISNDDGVTAPGIRALATALAGSGHEVHVVAPDRERSATGHALTLHRPLKVEAYEGIPGVASAWAVSGTPADCVKLALSALLESPPDLMCSGINRGPNLGTDVLYSGTVSAALEAVINGVPAIPFSLASFDDLHYEPAARFAARLVGQLAEVPLPPKFLLNVNCPALGKPYEGVRVTTLGIRRYKDAFEKRQDPRGRTFYWLAGEPIEEGEAETTDVFAVRDNCVSLTPIQYDLTHYPAMGTVEGWNIRL